VREGEREREREREKSFCFIFGGGVFLILLVFEEERKGERQQNAITGSTETFARLEGPHQAGSSFHGERWGGRGGAVSARAGTCKKKMKKKLAEKKRLGFVSLSRDSFDALRACDRGPSTYGKREGKALEKCVRSFFSFLQVFS
jgi:hypothetical protein